MENKKSCKWAVLMFAVVLIVLVPLTIGKLPTFDLTLDEKKQLALNFIEKVAGINLSGYTLDFIYSWTDETVVRDWSLQIFNSNKSIDLTFDINREVADFRTHRGSSPPSTRQGETVLEVVTDVLDTYNLDFNASYCTQFMEFLDEVLPNQNQTITRENIRLIIKENGYFFKWHYIDPNGLEVDYKNFEIKLSDEGYLRFFSDWWGLIHIGSTEINISEEEAIAIALPYAQEWAEENGRTIEPLNETFLNYDRMSRGDRYTVYPMWHVEFDFNGGIIDYVYGYQVSIWADTGELDFEAPAGVMSPGSGDANPLILYVAVLALIGLASIVVYAKRFRKK